MLNMRKTISLIFICLIIQSFAKSSFDQYLKIHGREYSSTEYLIRKALFEERFEKVKDLSSPVLDKHLNELIGSDDGELLQHLKNKRDGILAADTSANYATADNTKCFEGIDFVYNATYWYNSLTNTQKNTYPNKYTYKQNFKVIRNQGSCGSCYAQSGMAMSEFYVKKETGKEVYLSSQDWVCNLGGGCSGSQVYRGYAMSTLKTDPLSFKTMCDLPYTANPASEYCVAPVPRNYSIHARCWGFIHNLLADSSAVEATNEQLMAYLYHKGPISVTVNAGPWATYSSGVLKNCDGNLIEHTSDLHAVVLVGYNIEDSEPYFEVLNSWGKEWGEDGFIRIAMPTKNGEACGLRELASSVSFNQAECNSAVYPVTPKSVCDFTTKNPLDVSQLPAEGCVKIVEHQTSLQGLLFTIIFLALVILIPCCCCFFCIKCCCCGKKEPIHYNNGQGNFNSQQPYSHPHPQPHFNNQQHPPQPYYNNQQPQSHFNSEQLYYNNQQAFRNNNSMNMNHVDMPAKFSNFANVV
eukprot:TRINITY_DN2082_c0_g1_i1.p1 TRINITY_DN2082_c0_g1~~TRINITY_DN2082_c0_g1_i1.p1  ORF type:complete len:523 (+),score=102.25 TRINITY_DN2082_c0_g1_i1:38-1606(+)